MELNRDIKHAIVEWLINGVTYREIKERLGWLKIVVTDEEIKQIAEEFVNDRKV